MPTSPTAHRPDPRSSADHHRDPAPPERGGVPSAGPLPRSGPRPSDSSLTSNRSLLGRLGGWCFDHRRATVGLWLAVLVVVIAAAGAVGPAFADSSAAPGSDSEAGVAVLDAHFPELGAGGQSGTIVFRSEQGVDDPTVVAAMEELFRTVDAGFPDEDGVPRAPGATVI